MTRDTAKRAALKVCKPFRQGFDKFIFPIIARMAQRDIIADLIQVQPMTGPSASMLYLDFRRDRKPRWFWRRVDNIRFWWKHRSWLRKHKKLEDMSLEEIYDVEAKNPPLVGSRTEFAHELLHAVLSNPTHENLRQRVVSLPPGGVVTNPMGSSRQGENP